MLFDFLLNRKVRLLRKLYPHLDIILQGQNLAVQSQLNTGRLKDSQQMPGSGSRTTSQNAIGMGLSASKINSNNQVVIPERLSHIDILMFFQKSRQQLFRECKSPVDGNDYQEDDEGILCNSILALHFTIDLFRVLASDQRYLTITSLIDYVNSTEHFPLSVTQTLDLFNVTSARNLDLSAHLAETSQK